MDTRPGKGTVILIPGNSASSRLFACALHSGALAFPAVAVDLAGHGALSERTADYTFEHYLQQIEQAALEAGGPVLLAGNSLGGHLALRVAPRLPQLAALCLFGTPPLIKPANLEEAYLPNEHGGLSFMASPAESLVRAAFAASTNNNAARELLVEDFMGSDGKARTSLPRQMLDADKQVDEVSILKALACKKALLHGTHDIFVNGDYVQRIAAETGATLFSFEHSGHYPSLDEPEKFVATLNVICREAFSRT